MDLRKRLFIYLLVLYGSALFSTDTQTRKEIAVRQADTILSQERKLGLTRHQLIKACLYIQHQQKRGPNSCSRPRLPCTIERLRHPNGFVIRGLRGPGAQIGHGFHKQVTKAILFSPQPRIIAHCDGDATSLTEIHALKRLQGTRGVVPFLGAVARPHGRYSIFLEYYPLGSLDQVLNGRRLTERQFLKIAADLIRGLHTMHKRQLVHRDLHGGNFLVREEERGNLSAVLADLGQTRVNRRSSRFLPEISRFKNPPELLRIPLDRVDRFKADVYALGCALYKLLWQRAHPWIGTFNAREIHSYSLRQRRRMHARIVQKYIHEKKKRLARHTNSPSLRKFSSLLFDMLHFDPRHRPTTATLVDRIDEICY